MSENWLTGSAFTPLPEHRASGMKLFARRPGSWLSLLSNAGTACEEAMMWFNAVIIDSSQAEARVGADNPLDVLVGKRNHWKWGSAKLRRPLTDEDRNPVLDEKGKRKWGVVEAGNWCGCGS